MKIVPLSYLIFGAPGSGKTTNGAIIAATLNPQYRFVDMSRICKVASSFDIAFANLFAEHSSKGLLVPNEEILPRFKSFMHSVNQHEPIVGSGIFRTERQVHYAFQEVPYFKDAVLPFAAIRIKLDPKDAVQRCRDRAEADIKAGRIPRETDLDDEKNILRVKTYEDEVEGVFSALKTHTDLEIFEVSSMPTIHQTFMAIIKATGREKDVCLNLVS